MGAQMVPTVSTVSLILKLRGKMKYTWRDVNNCPLALPDRIYMAQQYETKTHLIPEKTFVHRLNI